MFASVWQILTAIFLISALTKLVCKLIKQDKSSPAQFDRQQQVSVQQQQVAGGEQSLLEHHNLDIEQQPTNSYYTSETPLSRGHYGRFEPMLQHQLPASSAAADSSTSSDEDSINDEQLHHHTKKEEESSDESSSSNWSSSFSGSSSHRGHIITREWQQINEQVSHIRSKQQTEDKKSQATTALVANNTFTYTSNYYNKNNNTNNNNISTTNNNTTSSTVNTNEQSNQIGQALSIIANSLLIEPCKFFLQVLNSSIKLIWSILDSIEGIEAPQPPTVASPSTYSLATALGISRPSSRGRRQSSDSLTSNHHSPHLGASSDTRGSRSSWSSARRSNYFHRRYRSRRSLSAALLDDLLLEEEF